MNFFVIAENARPGAVDVAEQLGVKHLGQQTSKQTVNIIM